MSPFDDNFYEDLNFAGLDHRMEESMDAQIAAQTSIPLELWLKEGPDIDSDAYSLDSEESPELLEELLELPDFDYIPGTLLEFFVITLILNSCVDKNLISALHAKRCRAGEESSSWYPWPDKTV